MADKRYDEFPVGSAASTQLLLTGDPGTGQLGKITVGDLPAPEVPNLQQVTDEGNTTTNIIQIVDGSASTVASLGWSGLDTTGQIAVINTLTGEFAGLSPVSLAIGSDGAYIRFSSTDASRTIDINVPASWVDANHVLRLPQSSGIIAAVNVADDFADDTAAAAGGVNIGEFYHTSGVVKVRLT